MKQNQQSKKGWRHCSCNTLYSHIDWWEQPKKPKKVGEEGKEGKNQ